ncbi:hypothetical protein VP01_362g10 [Puccinia sorghi]|uniref:Uncharacterized protein n=1 Tax=Puccinia sorghi TaxID=27349 RepID=A0A0L6UUQ7_9BASI|nr:hypothetical protein VP01_362g10 [Puccinia sorghi]
MFSLANRDLAHRRDSTCRYACNMGQVLSWHGFLEETAFQTNTCTWVPHVGDHTQIQVFETGEGNTCDTWVISAQCYGGKYVFITGEGERKSPGQNKRQHVNISTLGKGKRVKRWVGTRILLYLQVSIKLYQVKCSKHFQVTTPCLCEKTHSKCTLVAGIANLCTLLFDLLKLLTGFVGTHQIFSNLIPKKFNEEIIGIKRHWMKKVQRGQRHSEESPRVGQGDSGKDGEEIMIRLLVSSLLNKKQRHHRQEGALILHDKLRKSQEARSNLIRLEVEEKKHIGLLLYYYNANDSRKIGNKNTTAPKKCSVAASFFSCSLCIIDGATELLQQSVKRLLFDLDCFHGTHMQVLSLNFVIYLADTCCVLVHTKPSTKIQEALGYDSIIGCKSSLSPQLQTERFHLCHLSKNKVKHSTQELDCRGYFVGLPSSNVFEKSTCHQLTQTKVLFLFQLSQCSIMNCTETVCLAKKSLLVGRFVWVFLSFCELTSKAFIHILNAIIKQKKEGALTCDPHTLNPKPTGSCGAGPCLPKMWNSFSLIFLGFISPKKKINIFGMYVCQFEFFFPNFSQSFNSFKHNGLIYIILNVINLFSFSQGFIKIFVVWGPEDDKKIINGWLNHHNSRFQIQFLCPLATIQRQAKIVSKKYLTIINFLYKQIITKYYYSIKLYSQNPLKPRSSIKSFYYFFIDQMTFIQPQLNLLYLAYLNCAQEEVFTAEALKPLGLNQRSFTDKLLSVFYIIIKNLFLAPLPEILQIPENRPQNLTINYEEVSHSSIDKSTSQNEVNHRKPCKTIDPLEMVHHSHRNDTMREDPLAQEDQQTNLGRVTHTNVKIASINKL